MNTLLVLQNRAVKAAQEERWNDARESNLEILQQDPKNIGALNRLGFAYLQENNWKEAQRTYEKVLEIDRTNAVAKKYLTTIEKAAKKPVKLPKALKHSDFIDEPGKTKSVNLVRLADNDTLENLSIGADCEMKLTKSRVSVACDGTYIGSLPDDVFSRLQPLLEAGNTYSVRVQSLRNGVRVFIRETFRADAVAHIASFPSDASGLIALDHAEIAREDEEPVNVSETGEEDDTSMLENRDIDEALEQDDDFEDVDIDEDVEGEKEEEI